ncbi:MAG: N-6 DNA methylase [Hyphomicrobiaceae bacterium]|nr:N-6 DNA methylase [Hyphomicrobiaceae bacterium]
MARNATRRRSSRRTPRLDFAAIEITGALLTPDIVARIASFDAADQTEEAYGVPPGLKIRDEIARYFRIAEALWHQFEAAKVKSPAASERFMLDLLKQCFGFDTIKAQKTISKGEREFPFRHGSLGGRVPIVIAPVPAEDVRRTGIDESLIQFGDGSRRRSATLLLQEYLNAEDDAVWGICADGLTLRLLRDNVSLTRPAWIEADLAKIFTESLFPDFSALWLLIHQSRFGAAGSAPTDCALEHWRDAGRIEGTAAREKLRNGVEAALIELGQGFIEHPANVELRTALSQGKLSRQAYFEELLRLVYRLIFLFAAEDRDLLHTPAAPQPAVRAYAQGYSVGRLRERCIRRTSWDKNVDVWEGLKATFRALSAGQALLGLPALGGLFAQGQLPHLRECRIENRRLLAAIWRLAWMRPEGQPLTRVNWRDMETEELGSVYEGLLELTPLVSATDRSFTFAEGAEGRGNARKTSGSYYTPDALVQALLDETLNPLIEETIAGKDDQAAIDALLNLRIIDPACGSGHFLLAAARRLASRIARLSSPGTPSQADYRHWLREVARRTLFGVDKNPMAIELAKVALWIETVEPGKPLSFLDAHLRCGDSLLGVYDLKALEIGIPDDAYKPLTGDDKTAAAAWKKLNKQARERDDKTIEMAFAKVTGELGGTAQKVEAQAEDDLTSVEAKRKAFNALVTGESYWRVKTACDLYVAAFLLPKVKLPDLTAGAKGITIPTTSAVRDKLSGLLAVSSLEATAIEVATAARAFHWPLEFPQVFFPGAGRKAGFDLALGNPPWEVTQLNETEYFASKAPEIANLTTKLRKEAIESLASQQSPLWLAYQLDKRISESRSNFARASGRFPLSAQGKVNTYALFAELFQMLSRRAAFVVPSGIAMDASTSRFFAHLVRTRRLASLIDFENRERLFPDVYFRVRFCLLSLASNVEKIRFSCFLTNPSQIVDPKRTFILSPSDISSINPNSGTAPAFRSEADAALTRQLYSQFPIIVKEAIGVSGNPWGIDYRQGLFNMTSDANFFRTAIDLDAEGYDRVGRNWSKGSNIFVPLYEAKMFHQYNHRFADFANAAEKEDTDIRELPQADESLLSDPSYEPKPRYWVPEAEVDTRLLAKGWNRGWLVAWRDITNVTNQRTVIASGVPRCGIGHNAPLLFLSVDYHRWAAFISIISSLIFDYVARQKVGGTHLTYSYFNQLPCPSPDALTTSDLSFIVPRVLELTYTSHSMKPFADDLGYSAYAPFAWNEDRRALLRAELDAKIAKLYGLSRDQLRYILDPAEIYGPDYPSETFRVLKNNDIAKYGEYRTAKLVLDAWDLLERGELA